MNSTTISEITDGRDAASFPVNTTLKDLIQSLMENWRIHNFYLVDEDKKLMGVIKKTRILEFLTPVFCTAKPGFDPALDERLGNTKIESLLDSDFPCLTPGQSVPAALAQFVENEEDYLPLIDRKGTFLGEISSDSLLKALPAGKREYRYVV